MCAARAISSPSHEVLAEGFVFVEAPRCADDGAIYFSDLTGGGLYKRTASGRIDCVLPDRKWIGGCVLADDGTVLCSGQGGIVRLDETSGRIAVVLSKLDGQPIDAVNDIEADDAGGLYGGTIDFTAILTRGEHPQPGVFFRIDPSGHLDVLREGVIASNGIAFSPDRKVLYHAETTRGVWAWDLDTGGVPRNPVMFAELVDCDGLAVDAEGGVWVARWQTGEIVRFRTDATVDFRWRLPFPYVVSLTFAGEDLQDMIVTTGGEARPGAPLHGAIVSIRTEVPGQASCRARLKTRGAT